MRKKIAALTIAIVALTGITASAYTERTLEIHCNDYGIFEYSVIVEDGYFILDDEEIGIDDGFVYIDDENFGYGYDDGTVIVEE